MGEVITRNTTPYPGLQQVQVDGGRENGETERVYERVESPVVY
jgi:hypothetical protein